MAREFWNVFDIDLLLAIAHHLAVFTAVAIFAAEFVLLRPGIEGKRMERLAKIDGAYGAVAGLVVVAGILRVIFGSAGWEYYVGNWVFWAKMVAFLGVGLASLVPTVALIRWRRAGTVPTDNDVNGVRRFIWLEAGLFIAIPILAATLGRGYGSM
jgi:putative membrane protein